MSHEPDPWDSPAWDRIRHAEPGLPKVMAALQALRDVCGVTAALGPRTPEFSPGSGWHTADGALALLELSCGTGAGTELELASPPSAHAAEPSIDRLFREAADHTLAATLALNGSQHTDRMRTLVAVMQYLADGYRLVFGRPW